MKTSEHIQELILQLSQTSIKDYNKILKNFDFEAVDFGPFQSWSKKRYTRNCIHRDMNFELILLCWEAGQETAIHGHDGEDCWVYLLEGELEEVLYNIDEKEQLKQLVVQEVVPNQLTFMNDRIGYHKLRNVNKGRSLSLHVYAKPIERCRFFDASSREFKEKVLSFDTFRPLVSFND